MWRSRRHSADDDARRAELEALQQEVEHLRTVLKGRADEMSEDETSMSDEQREAVIKRARAELPRLDEQLENSLAELERIAAR